jgi:uncharacterized protein YndB with AHSA1/START domain
MTALSHDFAVSLPAAPERVFTALTEAAQLQRWFAEHADVEPRVGGAFRFWGKHTYGVPTKKQASQTVRQIEPGRLLAFDWRFADADSEVRLELTPDGKAPGGAGTTLKGRHDFHQPPNLPRAKELVDDLWRLNCGNLLAYLKGGAGVLLPDYADPSPSIRLAILIDAPRERVFKALLDPAILNRWIAGSAVVDPRPGGAYSYGWHYKVGDRDVAGGPTKILELVENERLVTDWPDWRGNPDARTTTITWLVESVGDQTRVTLIHAGFERSADISDYPHGWSHFLGKLKTCVQEIQ